jgi:hypothetical protein
VPYGELVYTATLRFSRGRYNRVQLYLSCPNTPLHTVHKPFIILRSFRSVRHHRKIHSCSWFHVTLVLSDRGSEDLTYISLLLQLISLSLPYSTPAYKMHVHYPLCRSSKYPFKSKTSAALQPRGVPLLGEKGEGYGWLYAGFSVKSI